MDSNDVVLGNARSFAFRLTDVTAKKNLLASARRIAFEKDPKQKSTKMKFSAGAYLKAVLPTIRQWKENTGNVFDYGSESIKVSEVKAVFEEDSKHFDTKVVFFVNGNKIVIHSYNST